MNMISVLKKRMGIVETKQFLCYCGIIGAYLFGIFSHLYLGFVFLMDIWRKRTITDSFPFMMAWGILMIWAIRKPIERKGVLLLTAILTVFMFIAEMSISHLREHNMQIPLNRVIGIVFWSIEYIQCFVFEHWEEAKAMQE